jgi:hypothetical protein
MIAFALLALVACALAAETSEYYPIKVDVVKIYSHGEGFRVVYRRGQFDVSDVFLPKRWFVPNGKAVMYRGTGPAYPYMVVYYKEGKFDHVKLYVQDSMQHESWGYIEPSEGRGKFEHEEIKLLF